MKLPAVMRMGVRTAGTTIDMMMVLLSRRRDRSSNLRTVATSEERSFTALRPPGG